MRNKNIKKLHNENKNCNFLPMKIRFVMISLYFTVFKKNIAAQASESLCYHVDLMYLSIIFKDKTRKNCFTPRFLFIILKLSCQIMEIRNVYFQRPEAFHWLINLVQIFLMAES